MQIEQVERNITVSEIKRIFLNGSKECFYYFINLF
jgi:hypothetical protein